MNADAAVIVFARAPLPGRAKTRLVSKLGAWGAARLQARLTVRAVQSAIASGCGPVELHGTPRARHPFFLKTQRRFGIALRDQAGQDLGERMHRALRAALRRHRYVLLMGVDAPELRAADLRRGLRLLRSGCDAVLAPAEDGGYAMIACRRAPRPVFERVDWGGNEVYGQTVERLARLRLRWRALRKVWDVDRPADVERLGRHKRLLTPGAS
ncbi:MAG TPA: TIGR04282 family arsenosugar biosynthesis glycosyltransferase [Burkholderiales bacterium]|nr:TIGR04282 family arsenosugar biosynthesis glycosyltransferase [Burkholderiales bacterium]